MWTSFRQILPMDSKSPILFLFSLSAIPEPSTPGGTNLSGIRAPCDLGTGFFRPRTALGKTIIHYFSADFHDHATAYLMADCSTIVTVSFYRISFAPKSAEQMRVRIKSSFDEFHNLRTCQTAGVEFSRSTGIDIAVDLKGFTQGSRPEYCSPALRRCRPVFFASQAQWEWTATIV